MKTFAEVRVALRRVIDRLDDERVLPETLKPVPDWLREVLWLRSNEPLTVLERCHDLLRSVPGPPEHAAWFGALNIYLVDCLKFFRDHPDGCFTLDTISLEIKLGFEKQYRISLKGNDQEVWSSDEYADIVDALRTVGRLLAEMRADVLDAVQNNKRLVTPAGRFRNS